MSGSHFLFATSKIRLDMPQHDYDYLIVGQGLAGTCLAFHLIDLGKKVLIIGDPALPSSSKVAAGIFNPLTGKKLVKTWLADDLFPYAKHFYQSLEERLGARFYHELPMYRPFRSIEEQNTYLAQTAEPGVASFVSTDAGNVDVSEYIHAPFGGLKVIRSGWVNLPLMLESARSFFVENDHFVGETFNTKDLEVSSDAVYWKEWSFNKVVFCQGFMALENDFFNWLPFAPVKGQILEVATEVQVVPYIINQGIFLLPVSASLLKVGATYSWDPLDWQPAPEATGELEAKLRPLIKVPYLVKSALAGVRPSVKDRRPLIGIHPERSNIAIFNGLGTKGVTLGPFFANQLAQHLETGKELNPAVNITRYFSLYFH
jgi:glycine/D-amino acid oxidase-like deaminating enzyme